MFRIVIGIFFILHGLVHMLYFGQSTRFFELQSGMVWPDGSWVFSRFLGMASTRNLASILLILAGVGFIIGGAGIFLKQAWWQPVIISVAMLSTLVYILFWDGDLKHLDNSGGIGILINLATLVALLIFHWPNFE